ncbi:magnesium transporter CorA family protein [Heyndrickxia sp. NPDC080065]|uniref:magnesium transporter CorA family protein n=1 Tax=Heyndrickxia sp. NPDC080065 TaxID=3390568 RepID=UPI003D05A0FC
MLNIYKSDEKGLLQEQSESVLGSWGHPIEPAEEELHYVASRLGVPVDFIRDPLDANERPRIEKNENNLLLIINVPLKMADGEAVPYRTVPIGIIQTSDLIVTICRVNHPILQEVSKELVKQFYTNMKTHAFLQLLLVSARYYLHSLDDINQKIIAAEKEIQKSIKNSEVYTLLNINKSLGFFTKALKINLVMMQKLVRVPTFYMNKEDEKWMQAALIEMQQAFDTSEIFNTNLGNLMDAYSAAIENNLSAVVKVLTAFTVIGNFPLVIAAMYGMNFPLPFQDGEYALAVLMSLSLVMSLVTGWIFYKIRLF